MILFCQLDVTGRTEQDPAAAALARNILGYAARWKPAPRRHAVYVGDSAGKFFFDSLGVELRAYRGELSADDVLIAGPGCGRLLAGDEGKLARFMKSRGSVLAVGLDATDVAALPVKVTVTKAEHIASFFEPFSVHSPLSGVGPADVHNRDPRDLSLITSGAHVLGDGVVAMVPNNNVVFLQMPPWLFAGSPQPNLRRTYRHAAVVASRLLCNTGVAVSTPLVERLGRPVDAGASEKRWLDGLYLDQPEEWDDPYRFFRW
jgi:hypothetical protein